MTRRDLLFLGFAWLALLGSSLPSRADDPPAGKGAGPGLIYAYSWAKGGARFDQAIFALDVDRLTWTEVAGQSTNSAWDTHFRISPDGRHLGLEKWGRDKEGKTVPTGVLVRDLARDGAIREVPGLAGTPVWSPDPKRLMVRVVLADESDPKRRRRETWEVGLDGANPKKLAIPETEQVDDASPDGSWLLTCSSRDQGIGYQIYRMRPDGSDARRLTKTGKGVLNLDGRISPDGRRVAYWRVGDAESGVWVMDADGANPRRVFEYAEKAIPGGPSWSPDGRKLAFAVHARREVEGGGLEEINHRLMIVDLAGAPAVEVPPPLADGLSDPQWARPWKP